MSKLIQVLLVEDSLADATLIQEVFDEEKIAVNMEVVRDGYEAMDYLMVRGAHVDAVRPDVIILDLNMPKKDGRQLLHEIKGIPTLKNIPVVILSTSQADEDVAFSYNANANCYVVKPLDLDQLTKTVKSIDQFWFTAVQFPKNR